MEDTRLVFSNIMEKLLKQAQKNKNVLEQNGRYKISFFEYYGEAS